MQFSKLIPGLYAHFMVAKAAQRQLRPNPPKTADGKVEEFFEAATVAIEGAIKGVEALKLNLTTEDRIALLQAAQRRYEGPTGFTVGQIVTPRVDSGYNHAGKPHVILEFSDQFELREDPGAGGIFALGGIFGPNYGHRLDMRVGMIDDEGKVVTFWRESWRFEPHPDAPPKEKALKGPDDVGL